MVYVNEPCVVIGRHQNPWIEVNQERLKALGLPLQRRRSGGGTVYHDLGNLNFSFIYNRGRRTHEDNFKVIIEAVKSFGIHLEVNDRKDLCYRAFKVSGNAFYQKGNRMMHHGTLLVKTDFQSLWGLLSFDSSGFEQKGVRSVRSDVVNLSDINRDIDVKSLTQRIIDSFKGEDLGPIVAYDKTYASWQWLYGQTPAFKYRGRCDYQVSWGIITHIDGKEVNHKVAFGAEGGKYV